MKSQRLSRSDRPQSQGVAKLILLAIGLLLTTSISTPAAAWESERHGMSLQAPDGWHAMSDALLDTANASIRHVTDRGFIGGYGQYAGNQLLFPYMLVQFKSYDDIYEGTRPTHQLGERDKLALICNMIPQFGDSSSLPEDIDSPQFFEQYGSKYARLTRLETDGRFDFMGSMPHSGGEKTIAYHTHAVIGKDGFAVVTLFFEKQNIEIDQIINEDMRTLSFAEGFDYAALPKPPPPSMYSEPTDADAEASADANEDDAQVSNTAEEPANKPNATAAIIIIATLIAGFLCIAMIIWYLNHQKAQARKERARERRARLQGAPATTPQQHAPRSTTKTPGQATRRPASPNQPQRSRKR